MARSPRSIGEIIYTNVDVPPPDPIPTPTIEEALALANRILNDSMTDVRASVLLLPKDSNGFSELEAALQVVDGQIRVLINKLEAARN